VSADRVPPSARGADATADRIRTVKVAFFGTPEFAVPSLKAILDSTHQVVLVVAQPDRPAGRGLKLRKPPVAELALSLRIPLVQPARIRNEEMLETIRASGCELAVVVAYGKILPAALLEIPPRGFINVHASLLPKYRGAAPIQRAIESGERITGVTIMRIDEELDHGPMFAKAEVTIGPDERAPSVAARLAEAGGRLLVEQLDRIEAGTAVETPQEHAAATHAAKIDKAEGRVDWRESARTLYDRFRAFDPWPGLYADIRGEVVKLTEVAPVAEGGKPGTLLRADEDAVVGCGEGALRLRLLQRPGKRPASSADVLRGLGIGPGDELS
jgi:methionyl-tRNA formyltransferase